VTVEAVHEDGAFSMTCLQRRSIELDQEGVILLTRGRL